MTQIAVLPILEAVKHGAKLTRPCTLSHYRVTWDEWNYPEGVIFPIVTLRTIRPEDSGAARNARVSALNCTAKLKSLAVWACLGVYPLDMPRTPYRASEGKRSQ